MKYRNIAGYFYCANTFTKVKAGMPAHFLNPFLLSAVGRAVSAKPNISTQATKNPSSSETKLNNQNKKKPMLTQQNQSRDSATDVVGQGKIISNHVYNYGISGNSVIAKHKTKKFYTSYTKLSEVKLLTIGLASPLRIRQWAEKTLPNGKIVGEVLNANTLHHKTFKPQKGGLFCERIFGPLKDFECACGKVDKTIKQEYKTNLLSNRKDAGGNNAMQTISDPVENSSGTNLTTGHLSIENTQKNLQLRKFCPVCDVEYTWSVIRRYQLGYIKLVTPVTHVWYLKGTPSYLSILLDIKKRYLQNITYCSETLTLENSLRGNVGFLLNSPSEIFNLWQNSIKKLSTKNESYDFVSLKASQTDSGHPFNKDTGGLASEANHLFREVGVEWQDAGDHKNRSYSSKSNQILSSQPKSTIFRMNNYNYLFEDLFKSKDPINKVLPNLAPNLTNPSFVPFRSNTSEKNLLEFVTSLEFSNGLYLDFIPSIFNNLSTLNIDSRQGSRALEIFTKTYQNELPTSIYILFKSLKNVYKEALILAIKKIWKKIYQKSYFAALKKINYLVQNDKNRTILKSLYKQIEFSTTNPAVSTFVKSVMSSPEEFGERPAVSYKVGQGATPLKASPGYGTRKYSKIYRIMLKQVISTLKKLYKKQIIDRIKNLPNNLIVSHMLDNIMNSSYSQHKIVHKIAESIEKYLLNETLVDGELATSQTLNTKGVLKQQSYFKRADALLRPKLAKYSFETISTIFTKALLKPLLYKYLLSFRIFLSNGVQGEIGGSPFTQSRLLVNTSKKNANRSVSDKEDREAEGVEAGLGIGSGVSLPSFAGLGTKKISILWLLKVIKQANNLQIGAFETPLSRGSNSTHNTKSFKILKNLSFSKKGLLNHKRFNAAVNTYNGKSGTHKKAKLLKIVSNIYCLSHRELWDSEKDWQLFMLYNSSNSLTDLPIPAYKYRLFNLFEKTNMNFIQPNLTNKNFDILLYQSSTTNAFFSGPGMVYQLLNELNFNEIKKLDKQNRLILYQLNKYISKIKFFISNTKNNLLGPAKNFGTVYTSNQLDSSKFGNIGYEKNLTISSQTNFRETISYNMSSYFVKNIKTTRKLLKDLSKKRDLLIRRTKLIRKLFKKDTDPSSMILTVLPVLPPDLRPIVKMGGQIAASDLNRLYQRVIYRNDRLKKFLKDPATSQSYEMKYAQRLLQEAVDNLIQNGKSGVPPEKDTRGRVLKSLSDILKGKQGRFRQYLLGKRVDYSGRSVIVVGPKLKLHECGLPFEMAVELYLPFLLKSILNQNYAKTVIGAKTLIQTNRSLTWELLREILLISPVLLNRAPTLHRLGIQAFQPKLIEGRAILLHPLVCSAFNADFDGDQMAVHVPITVEARAEAWKLMLARNNILSPATGDPLAIPSQDMVLGCYYLTTYCNKSTIQYQLGSGFYFQNLQDVLSAYHQQKLDVHALVWVKWSGFIENGSDQEEPIELRVSNLGSWQEIYKTSYKSYNSTNILTTQYICTTPGRILMNSLIHEIIKN